MKPQTCPDCGAPVAWGTTKEGKPCLFDVSPRPHFVSCGKTVARRPWKRQPKPVGRPEWWAEMVAYGVDQKFRKQEVERMLEGCADSGAAFNAIIAACGVRLKSREGR